MVHGTCVCGQTGIDRQTDTQTDRQTGTQTDTQTEKQTDRPTNRQKDTPTHSQTKAQPKESTDNTPDSLACSPGTHCAQNKAASISQSSQIPKDRDTSTHTAVLVGLCCNSGL